MVSLGVVVIGRNEGERLRRCLDSVVAHSSAVVYVDSGSTDGSVETARSLGVHVVDLDVTIPFTAARARNEGLRALVAHYPNTKLVQFVDGDCEVVADWLPHAEKELARNADTAVVCGRRRERFPNASVYNHMCDMEWDTPIGEANACGGDALMRVEPLLEVGGYREGLIAGEEPELCLRLRNKGWKIRRLDAEMTLHDAAMTRFGQWWKRSVRAGHAFAECSWIHRQGPLHIWNRETRSTWFWGAMLPLAILAATWFWPLIGLALILGYVLLGFRIYQRRRRVGQSPGNARLYAFYCVLAKFPQAMGQFRYHWNRLLSRQGTLIEYKGAKPTHATEPSVKVAYLVNQYPHVSHSFIRREIRAIEDHGIEVERFTVRRPPVQLVDADDREEQTRTQVLLGGGLLGLGLACLTTLVCHPIRFARALWLATKLGFYSGRGVLRHWAYLAEACVLVPRLRRAGVRHLHSHFGTNATDVALLSRVLGGPPYSFTIHGPEEFDRPEQLALRRKTENAAFVATVSEFGRSQLFRWCSHKHWSKIHVIHCGVDQGFLGAGPQPIVDNQRIVCVGRLAEQKGQLRLLQSLALLREKGVVCEAVLAGDGPMRDVIEAEIARLGLTGCVQITGWLSGAQVRQHLLEARVMVLPSFAEGLPVVLMEALALGRPVITTYVAGIPELVQTGINGWLIPAGSIDALANAIQDALATPSDQLTQLGQAGATRVARSHDVATEAGKLAELLTSSISGSGAKEVPTAEGNPQTRGLHLVPSKQLVLDPK
jgi:glycosyltransferase involved in cell wall biosynthesis/GT2 family glycosyltransferase